MITTALQFSGGKDSLAILHLYRDQLDTILVAWVNTGAAYPATIAQMNAIAQTVPHFLEIQSDQPAQIEEYGFPSDVVPLHSTSIGRAWVKSETTYRIQDSFNCCAANRWLPMRTVMKERGITKVIHGQRRAEKYTVPITNGIVIDGVEYILPIEDWTDAQVFAYLKENNVSLPDYYAKGEGKSHDCWSCTGYLDEDQSRIRNLPREQYAEVMRRLDTIDEAITLHSVPRKRILENWE